MEIKTLVENGVVVKVKFFKLDDVSLKSEKDVEKWFEEQQKDGWMFFKAYQEKPGGEKFTLFIQKEDMKRITESLRRDRGVEEQITKLRK